MNNEFKIGEIVGHKVMPGKFVIIRRLYQNDYHCVIRDKKGEETRVIFDELTKLDKLK